jgi:hypothetical protein
MVDEVPAAPPPEPQPQPPPLPSPEVRKARRAEQRARLQKQRQGRVEKTSLGNKIVGALCITSVTGIVFAIAIPGLLSSQGARYSVRIEWERRGAEIDAIAEQARKDGKLPPAPEAKPRE